MSIHHDAILTTVQQIRDQIGVIRTLLEQPANEANRIGALNAANAIGGWLPEIERQAQALQSKVDRGEAEAEELRGQITASQQVIAEIVGAGPPQGDSQS